MPVMLGDARLAAEFADEMLEKGIYVIGFSYPVVPKGGECWLPLLYPSFVDLCKKEVRVLMVVLCLSLQVRHALESRSLPRIAKLTWTTASQPLLTLGEGEG